MHISVLGPIHIERDGGRISVGPRLQRLLAALTTRRDSVVPSERLADIVWDGDPPASAETTLRSYVTRLRNALDTDDAIVFQNSGYLLQTDRITVDADQFVAEIDRATIALQAVRHHEADDLLTTALGRWRGTPYGNFGDEEWARPERVRLEERRTGAAEMLIEVMLADGRSEPAVAAASSLVAAHPLRERPRELLMRALYIAGRQAESLRAFRDYRELLRDETGLDPSVELADLENEILAGQLPRNPVIGRARSYELGEVLGRGAFSVVHRAVQPGIGRAVAVKIVRAELADRPDFVRRFEAEAQLVATVEHPHVVPLYDFWREPGAAFLVMRWMRGGSLARALRDRGPMSREQVGRAITQVGGALHASHRAGVLHRDVRPANLLLDDDGAAYLADFGIAVGSTETDQWPVHYAAPELLRGEDAAVAGDIHSLAVTTFELLTGRLPFSDTTDRVELVRRQLTESVPSVRATRSDLPMAIDEVLARATSKVAADRHQSVPEFVDDMIAALAVGQLSTAVGSAAAVGDSGVNPYVGLHAFSEVDADRFHGRDRLIGELADAVEHRPLVVVVGPSGSGKSSAVRAGLIPAVRRGAVPGSNEWFITTMFPGSDPIDALEAALLRVAVNPPASLREQLAEDGGLLRAVRRVLPDDDATVMVVIDQFEELFTVVESDRLRSRFLRELAAAIEAPGSPLRVVATLRADHYGAPLRDAALAELVSDGTVTIRPMRTEELERAITEPARSVGVAVEPALVAELVAGVTDRPAALPLLQFALTELYERRVAGTMLLETHHSLGGLTGALAARAERIIERGDDADVTRIRQIFGRLVAFGNTSEHDGRRRAPITDFGDDERTAWLIDEFVTARLLVVGRDADSRRPTVEIAHEALLRDWPRLARWIAEDRADLRVQHMVMIAAGEWEDAGRDDGMLARGGRLDLVSDLTARRPELLNDLERAWVDQSNVSTAETADRERRQRRRVRRALAATTVLLAFAGAAAAFALVLRDRAEANERAAEARELILEAEKAIDDDPELGLLLGLEAAEAYRASGDDIPVAALQVLRAGIADQHVRRRVPGGSWVTVIAERDQLATSDGDGGVAIWDLVDETATEPDMQISLDGWEVWDAGADGGRLLLHVARDGVHTALEVDPVSGAIEQIWPAFDSASWTTVEVSADAAIDMPTRDTLTLQRLGGDDDAAETFAMAAGGLVSNRDGRIAFPTGDDDTPGATIVDVTTGATSLVAGLDFLPQFAAVSPSGDLIALARQAGEIVIADVATGAPLWSTIVFERAGPPVWSPSEEVVAFGTEERLTVIDVTTGEVIDVLAIHEGGTWEYEFVDDDTVVTAGLADGATLVVDLGPGTETERAPITLPFAGLNLSRGPDDTVIVANRSDYAVVDVLTGRVIDSGTGTNVDGGTDFARTVPVIESNGAFVTFDDGISQLRRAADGQTVWSAPQEWSIRGTDSTGGQVFITRDDPVTGTTTTKVVRLRRGAGVATVEHEATLTETGSTMGTATFSPDGHLVVATSLAGDGSWLHTVDGELVRMFDADDFSPVFWRFTPDGAVLLGGGLAGDLRFFDVERLLAGASTEDAMIGTPLTAHDGNPFVDGVPPGGSLVATSARGEPARIWDIGSRELVAEFGVEGAASPKASLHASVPWVYVAQGTRMTTHTLDTDELLRAARSSVTRELTDLECDRFLRRACDR